MKKRQVLQTYGRHRQRVVSVDVWTSKDRIFSSSSDSFSNDSHSYLTRSSSKLDESELSWIVENKATKFKTNRNKSKTLWRDDKKLEEKNIKKVLRDKTNIVYNQDSYEENAEIKPKKANKKKNTRKKVPNKPPKNSFMKENHKVEPTKKPSLDFSDLEKYSLVISDSPLLETLTSAKTDLDRKDAKITKLKSEVVFSPVLNISRQCNEDKSLTGAPEECQRQTTGSTSYLNKIAATSTPHFIGVTHRRRGLLTDRRSRNISTPRLPSLGENSGNDQEDNLILELSECVAGIDQLHVSGMSSIASSPAVFDDLNSFRHTLDVSKYKGTPRSSLNTSKINNTDSNRSSFLTNQARKAKCQVLVRKLSTTETPDSSSLKSTYSQSTNSSYHSTHTSKHAHSSLDDQFLSCSSMQTTNNHNTGEVVPLVKNSTYTLRSINDGQHVDYSRDLFESTVQSLQSNLSDACHERLQGHENRKNESRNKLLEKDRDKSVLHELSNILKQSLFLNSSNVSVEPSLQVSSSGDNHGNAYIISSEEEDNGEDDVEQEEGDENENQEDVSNESGSVSDSEEEELSDIFEADEEDEEGDDSSTGEDSIESGAESIHSDNDHVDYSVISVPDDTNYNSLESTDSEEQDEHDDDKHDNVTESCKEDNCGGKNSTELGCEEEKSNSSGNQHATNGELNNCEIYSCNHKKPCKVKSCKLYKNNCSTSSACSASSLSSKSASCASASSHNSISSNSSQKSNRSNSSNSSSNSNRITRQSAQAFNGSSGSSNSDDMLSRTPSRLMNSIAEELRESFQKVLTPAKLKSTNKVLTDKEKVLLTCEQSSPLPFSKVISPTMMKKCVKIGEGVYGEVFKSERNHSSIALKIIPIEGDFEVNDEPQKSFKDMLPEIIISKELSDLRLGSENMTTNFVQVKSVSVVQGQYPAQLLKQWDIFHQKKNSENDRPDMFDKNQLFVMFEFDECGSDLEGIKLNSLAEAKSVILQVTCSLAVAEVAMQCEHRDLHWGNVLVKHTEEETIGFRLGEEEFEIQTCGVKVAIIDFTLSRLSKDSCAVYCDLSKDPTLFLGKGDYQFEVYRLMKKENGNNWEEFHPYTNVLWIHYITDKLIRGKVYGDTLSRTHKSLLREFRIFLREAVDYRSALHLFRDSPFFND